MTMPDRIPLPSNFTPPFTADERGTIWGSDGRYVAVSQDHSDTIARVLTAYYAEQSEAPSQPVGVPQFVVVNGKHGQGVYRTSDVRHVGKSHDGTYAALVADMPQPDPNSGAVEISVTEYIRLKSILAPGQ